MGRVRRALHLHETPLSVEEARRLRDIFEELFRGKEEWKYPVFLEETKPGVIEVIDLTGGDEEN